jgi:hypothetical protein
MGTQFVIPKDSTLLMMLGENSDFRRAWVFKAAALLVIAAFALGARDLSKADDSASRRDAVRAGESFITSARLLAPSSRFQVKSYFLDFAGDHSLDGATVIEQTTAGYAHYTVQLRLASGAEQSVVITAPPGGLQVEMQDMTGDHVPNDVLLRPALLQWLPTVLVNDGHDHFAVAISGREPGFLLSSESLGSRPNDSQTFALLMPSGFKALHLPSSRRLFTSQLQLRSFSIFTQAVTDRLGLAASPGRAPPLAAAV